MLQQVSEQRPREPFPRYGLAMELKKLGRLDEAWSVFEKLVDDHPQYVPTYLMAGGLLVDLGRREDASVLYGRGIEVAKKAGDEHTVSELEAAKAELGAR